MLSDEDYEITDRKGKKKEPALELIQILVLLVTCFFFCYALITCGFSYIGF